MQIIPAIYCCKHAIVKNLCQECRNIRGRICEHLFESSECLLCNSTEFSFEESIVTNKYVLSPLLIRDELFIDSSIETSMSEESSNSSVFEESYNSSMSEELDNYISYPTKTSNYGTMCHHDKLKSLCKKCKKMGIGGGSICEHLKKRSICLKCKQNGTGGGSYCDHEKLRSKCLECKRLGIGGRQLCAHDIYKSHCSQCR